jgi:hypothetical protein
LKHVLHSRTLDLRHRPSSPADTRKPAGVSRTRTYAETSVQAEHHAWIARAFHEEPAP